MYPVIKACAGHGPLQLHGKSIIRMVGLILLQKGLVSQSDADCRVPQQGKPWPESLQQRPTPATLPAALDPCTPSACKSRHQPFGLDRDVRQSSIQRLKFIGSEVVRGRIHGVSALFTLFIYYGNRSAQPVSHLRVHHTENVVEQHFQSPFVFDAGRHDQIRPALAGLDELQVHGSDRLQILLNDAVQCPPALQRVALKAPQNADVRIRVNEDLHIQLVSEFGQREEQQPLQHHDAPRQDGLAPAHAIADREIIDGLPDRLLRFSPAK